MEELKILLSERSQSEKSIYCIIPTIWYSGRGKTMKRIKRLVVGRRWRGMNKQSTEDF